MDEELVEVSALQTGRSEFDEYATATVRGLILAQATPQPDRHTAGFEASFE